LAWPFTLIFAGLIWFEPTRAAAFALQEEGGAIETGTVLLLLLGAAGAARAALAGGAARERCAWLAAALAFVFIAGEELAWGQHLLGRPLAPGWAAVNRQQETTIHNLDAFQGMSELWYVLAAGTGAACASAHAARFLGAATAPKSVLPTLALIAAIGFAEWFASLAPDLPLVDAIERGLQPMGEWNELLVACVAAVYGVRAWRIARVRSQSSVE
jgi:hypothetical protein